MPKILIVDDDKYINKLMSDRLSLEGFEVKSTLDGASAWQQIEAAEPPFDYLLADMLLPRMMGAELFSKIREIPRFEKLKMIAISGIYKDPRQIKEMTDLHQLSGYWTKPFDFDELIASIKGTSAKPEDQLQKGSLLQTPAEKVFLEAYNRALTGKVTFTRPDSSRRVYFSNGFPVSADSSDMAESLGRSLQAMGLIDAKGIETASRQMVEERLQLGQMLIKLGLLTKDQLFQALRKHTYKLLINTFSWREGDFEFEALKELPSYILPLEFNPVLVMLRAQKVFLKDEVIASLFETKMNFYCHRAEQSFQILPLFNLDESSIQFFRGISPVDNLGIILGKIPEPARVTLLRVFQLLEDLGLMEWKAEPADTSQQNIPAHADFKEAFREEAKISGESARDLQAEYMDLLGKNYFQILEVNPNSSIQEIEDAYRNIRYRLHPDRFGKNVSGEAKRILDDMLSRIDTAYQTLLSPDLKKTYLHTVERQKTDSIADSKRFLDAQDYFREAQKLLSQHRYPDAIKKFKLARETWHRGDEYELYEIFAEFKMSLQSANKADVEKILHRLKTQAHQQRASDIGFMLLGHAYVAIEQLPQARESYQHALQANERNEEVANALAGIAEAQIKKERFSRAFKKSKKSVQRLSIFLLLALLIFLVFQNKDRFFQAQEAGIRKLDHQDFTSAMPVINIRQKGDVAKIILQEGWITDVPDTVLNSKCIQLLAKAKSYGILEVYLMDEKQGLKAVCRDEKLRRYK